MRRVEIDATRIVDWDSFHSVFAETLGFPAYYGGNMDAWIDCMSDQIAGTTLLVDVRNAEKFKQRLPAVFDALVECSGFVNERYASADDCRLYLGFIG
jgi:RNAse (barnase) inhibitor barstar